jgi:hypothetical protein
MRTKNKLYLLLFVLVLTIMVAVTVANTAGLRKWWNKQPEPENTEAVNQKPDPNQVGMMNELMAWLKPFDSTNTSYYLDGLLTAVDKVDSANAMIEVPYTVCRSDKQFFLKVGQTETMNTNDHYLFIDHAAKKMLLGSARKLVQSPGMPINEMYNFIACEGFEFSKTSSNNRYTTIRVLNPNHISYKEFSVQYDSVARQVKKFFIRQAEVTDPMNADKEKWITLVIKDYSKDPQPGKYLDLQKFIQKKHEEWVPAAGFAGYDLINQ